MSSNDLFDGLPPPAAATAPAGGGAGAASLLQPPPPPPPPSLAQATAPKPALKSSLKRSKPSPSSDATPSSTPAPAAAAPEAHGEISPPYPPLLSKPNDPRLLAFCCYSRRIGLEPVIV